MLLSSAQSFKPCDKMSIKVYQVPYKPGFEEEFIEKSMAKSETKYRAFRSSTVLPSFMQTFAEVCWTWEASEN